MKNLVILCGGLSSRMGSDKAMLKIGEDTFVEHLYRNAREHFDRIIISIDTGEHEKIIRGLPLFCSLRSDEDATAPEIVVDNYEKAGPIGGMLSVFENTDVERFAVISTDVPEADMRVLSALYELCTKGTARLIMKDCPPEPLIAAYDRKVYETLKSAYEGGERRLKRVLPVRYCDLISDDELKCFDRELEDLDFARAFRNYNTQEELRDLYV